LLAPRFKDFQTFITKNETIIVIGAPIIGINQAPNPIIPNTNPVVAFHFLLHHRYENYYRFPAQWYLLIDHKFFKKLLF